MSDSGDCVSLMGHSMDHGDSPSTSRMVVIVEDSETGAKFKVIEMLLLYNSFFNIYTSVLYLVKIGQLGLKMSSFGAFALSVVIFFFFFKMPFYLDALFTHKFYVFGSCSQEIRFLRFLE